MKHYLLHLTLAAVLALPALGQDGPEKFSQLEQLLPTPNSYRGASGTPGPAYWQQRADYVMNVELDDAHQRITGSEVITYYNNSPDELTYLWLQLDQNQQAKTSDSYLTEPSTLKEQLPFRVMAGWMAQREFEGGYNISAVTTKEGKPLHYVINKTMMRVDLPSTLKTGQSFSLSVSWSYNINDQEKLSGRSRYEYFAMDDNYLYEIAQFFPRMAVYSDVIGWQHKQFLGRGEFTLPFGDYRVSITAPADHVVGATGELQNAEQVLSTVQRQRLAQARTASKPVLIISQEEATANEKSRSTAKKTWTFAAKRVRDFAFCSSRKFIWDARGVTIPGNQNQVLAMYYYPKEGNPLWGQYSTEVVAHTLLTYSRYSIDYPYPVAISVHGPVFGMEYPMICFNGGRSEADGTYPDQTKYALISVIIHEVGHNFFPMIVNSDERQWSWMDEGLNSFCEFLSEQEWERGYPSRRGFPDKITSYMKSDPTIQVPIMTNSESIAGNQFGNNAYGKPATALNILRETVMGRQLFDDAFKEYARRWAFKHPSPADFFRTMEDASAVDLDWFWRGWFYTTDHTDIAIDDATQFKLDTQNPEVEKPKLRAEANLQPEQLSVSRNRKEVAQVAVEKNPALKDYYNSYDPFAPAPLDAENYTKWASNLSSEERKLLDNKLFYYQVDFSNVGGLVMPIILKFMYADGSEEVVRIPAEIWRINARKVSKVFMLDKELSGLVLDPYLETADTDLENNYYPRKLQPTRFQLFKEQQQQRLNPMQLERQSKEPTPGSSH